MNSPSRRSFLGAGLALPALASAPFETSSPTQTPAAAAPASHSTPKFTYGTLGKTGMRVTRVSFGCMTTSDQSVIERAADMGIRYFDTARVYQGGNNERMVGAALKKHRNNVYISSKTLGKDRQAALALRWIVDFADARKGTPMREALAAEIMEAYQGQGNAIRKRDEVHKMAQDNKAFAHFRW